ncbi:pimeloyl-ACP methyl ester carboxylesterase [Lewinella marina]|uniref:Alpha/beta hydrolase n=1 Tax=Neolewinella marina TaxID=438751 RepID=A0A2G0CIS7_9BACT|nr:alpha/beta fold hydrolase [Neolewinella marina]NJB84965.1 pimeloyl-ACP methyl ester carboxylesterase [Neolewinella marina]PHK99884.1 alpha/beta hydrolase [Neolewinella marina]
MTISSKVLYGVGTFLVVATLAYFLGPTIDPPTYPDKLPDVPDDLRALERQVNAREAKAPTRPNNQARIVWHDSVPRVTEYAFVYLHGFAGSYRDGYPVNVNVPLIFGANIYLSRWSGHGLQAGAALQEFTPEDAWADAREALAIGRRIGRKVILMSTSTGGTLALKLAATFPEAVHALINIGPNVEDDQPGASLLMSPWGHELARLVSLGSNKKIDHSEPRAAQYFDTIYPSEALVNLEVLVQTTMTDATFTAVQCPVLTVYYKENFLQKDNHVEVSRFPEVHDAFATPEAEKLLVALPTPKSHFAASDIKSKDWMAPQRVIVEFCTDILDMEPLRPVEYVSDAARLQ